MMVFNRQKNAFTLAEVLIALALLGLIAAFTIPKLLQNQGQERMKSVMKANVSAVTSVVQEMEFNKELLEPNVQWSANESNILSRLNTLQRYTNVAPTNTTHPAAPSIPCKPLTTGQSWDYVAAMTDGSTIGLTTAIELPGTPPQVGYFLFVDGNGPAKPNEIGQDRLILKYSLLGKLSKPGRVWIPDGSGGGIEVTPINDAFYNTVFR